MQQLGRFSLRDEGKTIAIGKVMKIISYQCMLQTIHTKQTQSILP